MQRQNSDNSCHNLNHNSSNDSEHTEQNNNPTNSDSRMYIINIIGNILTWYCFSLMMPFFCVISRDFFPNDANAHMWNSCIFASGLFSRPLGAYVFGPIADKFGREKAIASSILLMAIPTALLSFVPKFEEIGYFAPLLLLIVRVLQGISLGGEYSTMMVHFVEKASDDKRGLFGSITDATSQIGIFFSGFAFVLYNKFQVVSIFGFSIDIWRLAFCGGIILSIFTLFLPKNLKKNVKKSEIEVIKVIKNNWRPMLKAFSITSFSAFCFYTFYVFFPAYLQSRKIISPTDAGYLSEFASVAMIPVILLSGYLSDKFNRRFFLLTGIACMGCLMFLIYLFNFDYSAYKIIYVCFGAFLGMYYGPRSAFFVEAFPSSVRCTALALAFTCSLAFFGGMTNIVSNWVADNFSLIYLLLPFSMIMCGAIVSVILIKDRTGKELE